MAYAHVSPAQHAAALQIVASAPSAVADSESSFMPAFYAIHGGAARRNWSFPTIGKLFSNHWKSCEAPVPVVAHAPSGGCKRGADGGQVGGADVEEVEAVDFAVAQAAAYRDDGAGQGNPATAAK